MSQMSHVRSTGCSQLSNSVEQRFHSVLLTCNAILTLIKHFLTRELGMLNFIFNTASHTANEISLMEFRS